MDEEIASIEKDIWRLVPKPNGIRAFLHPGIPLLSAE